MFISFDYKSKMGMPAQLRAFRSTPFGSILFIFYRISSIKKTWNDNFEPQKTRIGAACGFDIPYLGNKAQILWVFYTKSLTGKYNRFLWPS